MATRYVPAAGRTLAIALAADRPDVAVTAVDGDPEILALTQAKPGAGAVRWETGLATDLPLASAPADAAGVVLRAADPRRLRRHPRPCRRAHPAARPHGRLLRRPRVPAAENRVGTLELLEARKGD